MSQIGILGIGRNIVLAGPTLSSEDDVVLASTRDRGAAISDDACATDPITLTQMRSNGTSQILGSTIARPCEATNNISLITNPDSGAVLARTVQDLLGNIGIRVNRFDGIK
jgi:hypothetical protein